MEETKLEIQKNKLEANIALFAKLAWGSVVIGAIIFICTLLYIIFGNYNAHKDQLNTIGTFAGGSVASFWSLSGLFFIYVAFLGQKLQLLFQQEELRLQREELKATRDELEGQKKEMQEQNKTIALQRFENSFFNLLNNQITITNQLNYYSHEVTHIGKDVFYVYYKEVASKLNINTKDDRDKVIRSYISVYKTHQSQLANYFRNLYTIVDYVDSSNISEFDKYTYVKIVRSTLSAFELVLLFYNCLSENGVKKFKPLIEKYSFLKNLNFDLLIKNGMQDMYEPTAYKRIEPIS